MVNALAIEVEEGRDKLRYASGSCLVSFDPGISECGNAPIVMYRYHRVNT